MSDDDKMLNDAIQKHRDLREYYDAMGCKGDVAIQERYIVWLSELQEYRADVQEVKHGRWIHDKKGTELVCSVCGGFAPLNYYNYHRVRSEFCPDCGSKIDL